MTDNALAANEGYPDQKNTADIGEFGQGTVAAFFLNQSRVCGFIPFHKQVDLSHFTTLRGPAIV